MPRYEAEVEALSKGETVSTASAERRLSAPPAARLRAIEPTGSGVVPTRGARSAPPLRMHRVRRVGASDALMRRQAPSERRWRDSMGSITLPRMRSVRPEEKERAVTTDTARATKIFTPHAQTPAGRGADERLRQALPVFIMPLLVPLASAATRQ
jgi:hypothetical protein